MTRFIMTPAGMTGPTGTGMGTITAFSMNHATGTSAVITNDIGDNFNLFRRIEMETTRRSVLSKAFTAGVVTSVAGMTGLLSMPRSASAQERRYPKIHSALEALRSAREELHNAGEDFHGHKDEAMKAVDEAIRQLETVVEEHPR